jgi:hypothetical protein
MARQIVDPANPLTARVLVNRVWLHHCGAGLVTTPSDFGRRSDPPSHPELLDHLADLFVADGWSIKRLHRRIMTSAVYQQASLERAAAQPVDPENRLLWKMNRRRLEFETLRDALLAASDSLDLRLGGPPLKEMFGGGFVPRRTLYGFIDRLDLPSLLTTFDFPSPAATNPQREATTVAPQALFLMNHPFVEEVARRLVSRPEMAALAGPPEKIDWLHVVLFGHPPTVEEMEVAAAYLGLNPSAERWISYVQSLLMTNEFVFVD